MNEFMHKSDEEIRESYKEYCQLAGNAGNLEEYLVGLGWDDPEAGKKARALKEKYPELVTVEFNRQ